MLLAGRQGFPRLDTATNYHVGAEAAFTLRSGGVEYLLSMQEPEKGLAAQMSGVHETRARSSLFLSNLLAVVGPNGLSLALLSDI